ncbi:MAG: hypothetical protein RQ867_04700 [Mariprofundaceae bacterium]|nr:hypothetical protein [Mariprofundaceae bacterium]
MDHQARSTNDITKEMLEKMQEHMASVDQGALIILKGHLLIEEVLSEIISKFVFHPEQLDGACLGYPQKVALARSMSLDEHNNEMWQLINSINGLRNELAHSLRSPKRDKKENALIDIYLKQGGLKPNTQDEREPPKHHLFSYAIALCLGYLAEFVAEVERFRGVIDEVDRLMNPHRHK